MIPQKRILDVLGSLYESAKEGSAEAWSDSYAQMADIFSSGPGSLSIYKADNARFNSITNTFSDECLDAFEKHYIHVSPIQKKIVETPVGKIFWRIKDSPDRGFLKTEFYQDFAVKEDVYDIASIKLFHAADSDAMMNFTRPKRRPFTKDDMAAMSFFFPHLQRAIQIFFTMSGVRAQNLHLNEVVGKSPRGIILLNRAAKVVYCNEAAETFIISKDGLAIDRNRCLVATSSRETRQIRSVLDSVFDFDLERSRGYGGFLHISRPSGKRALQAHISPLSQQDFSGYSPEKLALLFVYDPEQRLGPVEGLLRQIYGLTPTEARLAEMLARGRSLKEAGAILNIKESTIRTHLKHIFSKTDCNRQAELITLIFNGLAGLQNL